MSETKQKPVIEEKVDELFQQFWEKMLSVDPNLVFLKPQFRLTYLEGFNTSASIILEAFSTQLDKLGKNTKE